jgi:osmotically-inducible protein OsmY
LSTNVDDTSPILRQVRAALEREPRVDLHHYPLNIDLGADGALIVEGELADIAAKKLALEAAAAVPGVAAVIDRLRVAPATRMTDGEIRDHIRDALFEEPAFENCGISIGSGGVAQMVRQRNSLGFIEASSDDAVVTLNGQVGSFSHKCLAGALAWWVPGSRDVINGLEVVPPQDEDDDEIAEAVGLVLAKDPLVNANRMRVRTENSVVTLEGLAANEKESEMAEMDAWCVLGVNRVINRLELK